MGRPSPKVLVIAEEETVQRALKERLVSEGCRVMQAFSWDKAVDFFSSERPDAVFLDIEFGGAASQINGVDLIQFIKKSRNYSAPLIVYGDTPDRLNAGFYASATTFVPKTTPVEELAAIIMGLLGDQHFLKGARTSPPTEMKHDKG